MSEPAATPHPDIAKVLLSREQIAERVREMGAEISGRYAGRSLHLVVVLRGAALFAADLIREITVPASIDHIAISSYGAGTRSSGVVRIVKDLEDTVEGRHVLVVEDIIDSGLTLNYLVNLLRDRGVASLETCAFLDKPSARRTNASADYIGFTVPDAFVVGYGLDYNQCYRGLPFLGVLKASVYDDAAGED